MNRGEKAAVYVVLVLAALAACSGILYLTGWATTIKNVVVLGGRGSSMTNLARRTPFVPPADGLVRRERLEAYLRICCAIKPVGDKIDAWEETHQHGAKSGKPAFKGQAAGLVGDFLRELETALQREEMGPAEFAWVADRMRAAGGDDITADRTTTPNRLLCEEFSERLETCALGTHARRIAEDFAR